MHHARCYALLDASPADGWHSVRAKHRLLIRKCHPDRFPDPQQKRLAEEKTKELNQAFQILTQYYEQHSTLPPVYRPDQLVALHDTSWEHDGTRYGDDNVPGRKWSETEDEPPQQRFRFTPILIALGVFAMITYYFFFDEHKNPNAHDDADAVANVAPTSDHQDRLPIALEPDEPAAVFKR